MDLINKNFPIYITVTRRIYFPTSISSQIDVNTMVSFVDGGVVVNQHGKKYSELLDIRFLGKFTDQKSFLQAMSDIIKHYKIKGVSELAQIEAFAEVSDGSSIDVRFDIDSKKFVYKDKDYDSSDLGHIKTINDLLDHIEKIFGEYVAHFELFVHYDEPASMGGSRDRIASVIEINCEGENKNPVVLEGYDIDEINREYSNIIFKDNYLSKEFLHQMNQNLENISLKFLKS